MTDSIGNPELPFFQPNKNGIYELTEGQKTALLASLNNEYGRNRSYQREARRKWTKLEAYVAGRQLYDASRRRAVGHEVAGARSASGDVDEEMIIINDIRRIHQSNMQRLTSYSIQANVIPNSKKPEDKQAARVGRIALMDMFRVVGEEKLKKRIARILGVYGTVFLKTYFDNTKGNQIAKLKFDEMGEPYFDQEDTEMEGQVVVEALSPRNILLPQYCQDIDRADWIEEIRVESVDFVYRRYGVKVNPESIAFDQWDGPEQADTINREVEIERSNIENSVVLKSRYVRPCPRFQRGAILVYTDKHLLWSSDLLTYYDDIPFTSAEMIYDDRAAWGESLLWDLIPLQDGINETASAMTRHVKMYGDLKLMIPASAGIDPEKLTNATAEHILYNGTEKPEALRFPELSQTHFSVFNMLRTMEMSLGAAHDITRANRAMSGNAIANLEEIDNTVLRPAMKSIEEALQKICVMALKIMAEYYTTPRVVKMSGMQGWQIEESFKGELLNNNFHASINLMSAMPTNKFARMEYINNLVKNGLIDREEARLYLEIGNVDDLLEEIQKDNEIADTVIKDITDYPNNYKEDLVLGEDGMPQRVEICKSYPHMFDNHALLVKKLLMYMRENYDHEPEPVKKALSDRLEFSQQFLAAQMTPGAPHPAGMIPGAPPPMPDEGTPEGPPAGADSFQNPSQQPANAGFRQPMVTGFTQ